MSLLDFADITERGERAEILADALLLGPPGHLNESGAPFAAAFGIRGAGLMYQNGLCRLAVFVDTADGIEVNEIRLESQTLSVSTALKIVFPNESEAWHDVYVLGIGTPVLQVQAGDSIKAASPGTLGVPVAWGAGRNGFLTAGHVAGAVGTSVKQGGLLGLGATTVGTVVASLDPNSATTGADIAVIELASGVTNAGVTYAGFRKLLGSSPVSVIRNSGAAAATVMAMSAWIHFPSSANAHADVYLTTNAVTTPGDSGAAAIDPTTSDVVGHVVGASPGMSMIQDVSYQLSAIKTLPGFAAIKL